jgi:hypothetical protein
LPDARRRVADLLRTQAGYCRQIGSPLYGELLERAADDAEAGGPAWSVLSGHEDDSFTVGIALMGAAHRLVLEGRAPELAARFPSTDGDGDAERAWPAFRDLLERRRDDVRELLERVPQTNEVGRAAALLGGFLTVSRETGLPLRLLELGASAGLNLRWDRYRYEGADGAWGDPDSAVRFPDAFVEGHPPLEQTVHIAERRGCDRDPVDPLAPEGRMTLLSYVWPDQPERFRRLEAALDVAASVPVTVDRADAVDWLEAQIAQSRPGTATVVFHSIVMLYLDDDERARLRRLLESAGERASSDAPIAHLAMEAAGEHADVRLRLWPGGQERVLAHAGYHGPPVRWLESRPAYPVPE